MSVLHARGKRFFNVQRHVFAVLFFVLSFLVVHPVHAREFPISLQGVDESTVSPELYACVQDANQAYLSHTEIRYSDWLEQAVACYRQSGELSLLPSFFQSYDFSTADTDFALENCNADVQRGQYARLTACSWSGKSVNACYAEEKQTTIQLLSQCYKEQIPEDSIWNLPIMQQGIEAMLGGADYNTMSLEDKYTLDSCLQNALSGEKADTLDQEKEAAIASCYTEVGLTDVAAFYTKTSIVVDCAAEAASRRGVSDIQSLILSRSADDEAYIEQCVIKKTAPVILGIAVVNIPFAAGFGNLLLYLQFFFTQPLLLLRGKRENWGKVLDATTGSPIDLSAVRLIDEEKQTVLRSMVTNKKGEYFFLPPTGTYRVEAMKSGYAFPSTLLKGSPEYYFGKSFEIESKGDVIDKHIPLDPAVENVSVRSFLLQKWRYRISTVFAAVGPLSSLIFLILVPKWWVAALSVLHILLFFMFRRLSSRHTVKQFGVVKDAHGKPLNQVKVMLFNGPYKKLLQYYVTDMFGRYYFPPIVGEFIVKFEKDGFETVSKDIKISPEDTTKTLHIDVRLSANNTP